MTDDEIDRVAERIAELLVAEWDRRYQASVTSFATAIANAPIPSSYMPVQLIPDVRIKED